MKGGLLHIISMDGGSRHQTSVLKLYQACEQYLFEYVEMFKVIFACFAIRVFIIRCYENNNEIRN